jgi:anti-sigma regulatory factor (Ser/Thr protein kinase)
MVTAVSGPATVGMPAWVAFEQAYPGTADQVHAVRTDLGLIAAGCPAAENLVLLASELATNAVLHSRSGWPGQKFTIRVTLYVGDYVWVEVIDQGGDWGADEPDDEHGRGLAVVAAVAGEGNWGIDGSTACRIAWFRLEWNQHEFAPAADALGGESPTNHEPTSGTHRPVPAAVAGPSEDWDNEFMRLAYCVG